MKIKTILTCAALLIMFGARAQCFTLSVYPNDTICLGQSAQLNVIPNTDDCPGTATYSWYPWGHIGTNFVITPTVTTTYTVISSNGTTLTGLVVVNPLPVINLSPSPSTLQCSDTLGVVTLTVGGAYTYTCFPSGWLSGEGGVFLYDSPLANTIYTVMGTDANGCVNTGTVNVLYDNTDCLCTSCGDEAPGQLNDGDKISGDNCVNTDIIVKGSAYIMNAELSIRVGVKIVIERGSQLTITDSHLFACGKMWQGIVIKNGGRLIMDNCLIEDAVEAVDVTNHINQSNIFEISNTTFNKNHIGIDIENYTEQITTYPFTLNFCLFTSRDIPCPGSSGFPSATSVAAAATNPEAPLSNPYIDNSVYLETGTNAALKFPYTGAKPEAGIRLRNVGLTIDPTSTSTQYYEWVQGTTDPWVYFDNLTTGMDLYNSNASVYNSVFQNSAFGINCRATPSSHNRLRVMKSSGGPPNQFVDCQNGILSQGYYDQTFTENDFRSTSGSTLGKVSVPGGIQLVTNAYRDLRIEDNTMYNVSTGILIGAVDGPLSIPGIFDYYGHYAGSMFINRNKISANVPGYPVTYQSIIYGIDMCQYVFGTTNLYMANASTQIIQVDKNEITDAEDGIMMRFFRHLNFSCNSNIVSLVQSLNPHLQNGILLIGSGGTSTQPLQLNNNIITGYSTSNVNCYGIQSWLNDYNDITCNYVTNVTHGYEFFGSHTNINFRNNEANANKYGFVLSGYGAIGTQGSATNPQDNTWSGFWPSGTYKTAVFGGSDAANSKFYMRSAVAGPYNPNGSSISTTPITSNTDYSTGNGNLIVSSTAPALAFCPIVPSTARMAQGGTKINEIQLLSIIQRKPIADPSADFVKRTAFYNLANYQGYNPTGSDSLSEFYREQQNGNIGRFDQVEKALGSRNLAEAKQINESVKATCSAEQNTKAYYTIAIHNFEGKFSKKDSLVLSELVKKCVYTEGLAIEKARIIYRMKYGWKLFADECAEKQSEEIAGIKDAAMDATSIQLYPNPTSGQVNIMAPEFGEGPVEINVLDISGRCVYNQMHKLENGRIDFKLSCASGVYLVTLRNTEHQANIKLIIQK